jgi:hypothetical protein
MAIDLHDFKLERLKAAAEKAGIETISTVTVDATDLDADLGVSEGTADGVLVDAPARGWVRCGAILTEGGARGPKKWTRWLLSENACWQPLLVL